MSRYFQLIEIAIVMLIIAIAIMPASATIINIPDDYPTIQEGIDASTDGDTVLVQPDTYVENINFNGHNIVLGSLFLTTEDTSYISTTVIDGNNSGTVVTFENGEDSIAVIAGFTIQTGRNNWGISCTNTNPKILNNLIKGNENYWDDGSGGGIYCDNASPIIYKNKISENVSYHGGGIYCWESNPQIIRNIIINNSAFSFWLNGYGGGICCMSSSNPIIINNVICENGAYAGGNDLCGYGGGIYCENSSPLIINNTISRNRATVGGGIHCVSTGPIIKNTIVWLNTPHEVTGVSPTISYCNIRGGFEGEGNIDENPLFIDPRNGNYNICMQSPCIDTGDPDLLDPDSTRSDIGVYYSEHPECFVGNKWHISITGNDTTGDGSVENPFRNIQHGIDISIPGDTVFVSNGTYIENIIIFFKRIYLVSEYTYSHDGIDVQNTIIDGGANGSVISLTHCDSISLIEGFTIRNGNAQYGGGFYCLDANTCIKNNIIINNLVDFGAGISCLWNSNPTIINNTLTGNYAIDDGSGIYCYYSNPTIINTIIWANYSNSIALEGESSPIITYSDIDGGWDGEGNINENPLFISPQTGNYNILPQSPCIDTGDPDIIDPDDTRSDIGVFFPEHPVSDTANIWFVSITGDDINGNGSYENPFRTIQHTIDICSQGDTIIVANGTYIENLNILSKNIVLSSTYIFSNDTMDIHNTIIDGDSSDTVILYHFCDSTSLLYGFTVRNGYGISGGAIYSYYSSLTIAKNIIIDNIAVYSGGGIYCLSSNPLIYDNIIKDNLTFDRGGGIYCIYDSRPTIINNNIINNIAQGPYSRGGGVYCYLGAEPVILGNTIVNNSSGEFGGGICCYWSPNTEIINNTIYSNSTRYGGGIFLRDFNSYIANTICWSNNAEFGNEIFLYGGSSPIVSYCNIQDTLWPGEGNIDVDPLFRDPENGDFHLMATYCGDPYDSPCIDAGHPDILDSLLDCDWGLGELRSDMGAYGGGDSVQVGIDDQETELPRQFALSQNYPNPFNASTTISYTLPCQSDVTIDIYDILGRKVETLVSRHRPAGYHRVIWKADEFSTGIYFYKLRAGEYIETKKMMLLR